MYQDTVYGRDKYDAKPATPNQILSLRRLWQRVETCDNPEFEKGKMGTANYDAFLETVIYSHMECLLVNWLGMTIGIEPDGYTHS
jgi:hypothetical protein